MLFVSFFSSACPTAMAQSSRQAQAGVSYGQRPMTFEANQGQTDPRVRFVTRGSGYAAFLTSGGMVLSLRPATVVTTAAATSKTANATRPNTNATLQFKLVGAAQNPAVVGEEQQVGRVNYFIGRDPSKWHTNVPTFAKVRYKNVYAGIDLVYYGNHRQLEYDFALAPGADPRQIQFQITGARQIQVDAQGDLVLNTGKGELHFQSPKVYQEVNGTRAAVSGSYSLVDSTHVAFHVSQYDATKALVIDPVLLYASYLGGSGDDQPTGIAVDSTGNVYVAGYTDSPDFPLATLGSLPSGVVHVFVAKLDATASNLIYADYIGGNNQDYGYALALDSTNEVLVTGSTASSDFPVVNAYQGTYPGSFNGFLTRVSADGSSLVYSTYLGGNGSDVPASVAVDSSNDVFVAGNTTSTNFPVANAYQSTVSPNQGSVYGNYGFLTKFTPDGSSLIFSTYFGGNSNVANNCGSPCWPSPTNAINGVAVDSTGNAYVAGNTNTYNFPTTTGAYKTTNTTQQDANVGFTGKFDPSGNLVYSTYFYETSGALTSINAIAVDSLGSAYITGSALSDGTFPVTSTSICDPTTSGWGCNFAFVTKFDPTGATLMYSTFLGLNNNASPQAIALDANNDAYITSSTSSSTFSDVNGIEPYTSGNDILLVEIDPTASSELFATYLGGTNDENPAGISVDSNGNIYLAGSTASTDFPVTPTAFQTVYGGNFDTFVAKIGATSAPAVSFTPVSMQYSLQTVGSTSQVQTVLLRNMGSSSMSITSITATGDFGETDNCGTSVPAAGNCTVSITFTPTLPGTRTGTISIQDDAAGSPHAIRLTGDASGPFATFAPASLVFVNQIVGTTSAAHSVTLSNTGNATLSISGIQASGDFAQTNNCSSTLAVSASCTINVTFTPTASGARTGALTVNSNELGSPETITLTGTGSVSANPIASLTPANVAFAGQVLGITTTAQVITLTNTGNTALSISHFQITGDFKQTNSCSATLANGASCTINVTFTPTVSGSRTGTLTITDNGQGSAQTVALTGTGSDFSLATSANSDTVTAGSTAAYQLTVSSVGGSFGSAVKLNCSGLPAQTSCSFSPSQVTPGSSSAKTTLSISTTGSVAAAKPAHSNRMFFAAWIQLQGFGLFGIVLAGSKKRGKKLHMLIVLALLIAAMMIMSACAGGTGIGSQSQTGTTPGSYTVTVTGASGSLQHSMHLTLTVQQ